jgi:hypothetical protein
MTIRVWFIGLFLALGLASIDTFFYFRNPAPGISPTLVMYAINSIPADHEGSIIRKKS